MKKYLLLSFLITLLGVAVTVRGAVGAQNRQQGQPDTGSNLSGEQNLAPSGQQVQNENQIRVQNQGDETNLNVSNQEVSRSFTRVSDQVKELIDTTGAKGGVGLQVREIAQNQTKLQQEIKADFEGL